MDFDYEDGDEYGPQILWYRLGLFLLVAVLLIALGRCTKGGGDVSQEEFDEVVTAQSSAEDALEANQSALATLQQENQNLRDQLAGNTTTTTNGTTTDGGSEDVTANTGPADAPTDTEGNRTYEVQDGDNLSDIAQAVYGDPLAFGIIAEANNLSGSSPLQVGQTLIIPANPDSQ